ncbi:hypothetical protein GF391_02205, partial [Candidatus Uhrbacteria bacterium]|nr:hypothetical protein [Candidatus Uhrbacteria bacterium]
MHSSLYRCLILLFCLMAGCAINQGDFQNYQPDTQSSNQDEQICSQMTDLNNEIEKPNYVILTRAMFAERLMDFVTEHSEKYTIKILVADDFVQNNTSLDVAEQIRTRLGMEYEVDSENYLLIVGAPDTEKQNELCHSLDHAWEIPTRYVPFLGEDTQPILDKNFIPTDQYYASVNERWDTGEFEWMKRFTFSADYLVGRVPVKTVEELGAWTQKNKDYRTPEAPRHSIFTNDACTQPNAKFPQDFLNGFLSQYTHSMSFHRCVGDDGGNISDFGNADQADFISVYSHGNSQAVVAGKKGYSLLAESADFEKPPIIFAHACDTAAPDLEEGSLGTNLIRMPNGALAYVGYTRSNTSIIHPFWEQVFLDDGLTLGKAVYASKQKLFSHKLPKPDEINDWFALTLFGDPSIRLTEPRQTLELGAQTLQGSEPITVCADIATGADSGNAE